MKGYLLKYQEKKWAAIQENVPLHKYILMCIYVTLEPEVIKLFTMLHLAGHEINPSINYQNISTNKLNFIPAEKS